MFRAVDDGFELLLLFTGDAEDVNERVVRGRIERGIRAAVEFHRLPSEIVLHLGVDRLQFRAAHRPGRIDFASNGGCFVVERRGRDLVREREEVQRVKEHLHTQPLGHTAS